MAKCYLGAAQSPRFVSRRLFSYVVSLLLETGSISHLKSDLKSETCGFGKGSSGCGRRNPQLSVAGRADIIRRYNVSCGKSMLRVCIFVVLFSPISSFMVLISGGTFDS